MSQGQGEGNFAVVVVEEGGAGAGTSKGSQQMMEGHPSRDSFNAAYESVEAAIRNFSKDKLGYEQQIEDLKHQLGQSRDSLQKLSADNQDVMSENRRLLKIHEESEKSKVVLDALIATVEQKQQIIIDAIAGFEQLEGNMCTRNENHEKFIVALKCRQNQLLKWIDATKGKNDALTTTIQKLRESIQSSVKDANEARMIIEKKDKELIDKVARLEKCDADFANLECEYKLCLTDLEAEKRQSVHFRTLCLDLEGRCKTLNEELTELKAVLHTKTADFTIEKQTMQNQYAQLTKISLDLEERCRTSNEALDEVKAMLQTTTVDFAIEKQTMQNQYAELTKLSLDLEERCKTSSEELDEAKATLQTEAAKFATEKQIMQDQYVDEITGLKDQLERLTIDHDLKKVECKNLQRSIQEGQLKADSMQQELAASKALMDQQAAGHVVEKLTLVTSYDKQVDDLKANLMQFESDLMAEKTKYDTVKDELTELMKKYDQVVKDSEEMKCLMLEKEKDILEEKSKLARSCDELNEELRLSNDKLMTVEAELKSAKITLKDVESKNGSLVADLEEYKSKLEENEHNFETEKERLIEEHDQKMQDEKRESDFCKRELKALNKRYHEQKLAISKLVEEVGVRPVLLPPSDPSRARARVTPSQEYQVTAPQRALPSPLPRPSATGSGLITPTRSVEDKSRRSILKRSKDESSTDTRSKNVTFGETSIADFLISSESETDSSGDIYIPQAKGNTSKRMKLTGEKAEPYKPSMDPPQRKNDDEGGKQRKYFKNRIAAPNKSPAVAP